MFLTLLLISMMLIAIVTWHYWALRQLNRLMPSDDEEHHHFFRVVLILVLLVCIHVIEIVWFAADFYLLHQVLETGGFTDAFKPTALNYIYYAAASYTTLGKSDFGPTGAMKLMTGFAALIGFVMLTWSATFFYSLSHRD